MIKKILYIIHTFLLVGLCFNATTANAKTINITTAGALSTLLSDNEQNVKIIGPINGTDVKYLRSLINDKQLSSIDLSEAKIVSGGVAYYNTYTTNNDVIGQYMFYQCAKLKNFILPKSVTTIGKAAFSGTGLTNIEIPDCVATVQEDGFAYCNNLTSVVIGKKISKLGKGTFYSSGVKNAYVKPQSVPDITSYLFSSRPTIHVYSDVLNNYKSSAWNSFGTLKGDLENTYPKEKDSLDYVKESIGKYYEDAACTILKTDYQTITDEDLVASMIADKMPSAIISMTLKVKNDSWEKYEKYYRIHDYDVYSDAKYWNKQLKSSGGSYMGNPTGIYTQNTNDLYVFVDKDVPSGATLYMAGCAGNDLVSSATTGTKLSKGVNVIPGVKDALFYIVYTADTKLCNKKLSEWSNIKIHIEGGIVNGYYDVANQTSTDYRAVLKNATHERFTIKGKYSLLNFKTTTYRSVWPKTIDKSIQWFDSITIWQKELLGICESVVAGSRNIAPYNMSGGDAFFPSYYNNPNFAIEGEDGDGGYANSTNYRTSYNSTECVQKSFDVYHVNNHDDWCAGHECGHNNQEAINIEGCTEVSNNLFACMGVLLDGFSTPKGETIATEMNDFAHHVPFFLRSVDSRIRMYYQLYLYYHQACRNTSFYPNLFKALREDPLVLEQGCNKSSLKFVRKVCKVANEDLTDFFNAWGFFEPCDLVIEDYGNKHVVATQADIDKTKAEIAKYTK
ncbi:MAG: M60 family metallopeptidase, partial [Prevotellaceae bacterium]|nr:M60 family metallopeptidase [Candidatus Faecinaster equi]